MLQWLKLVGNRSRGNGFERGRSRRALAGMATLGASMQQPVTATESNQSGALGRLLVRNTFYLTLAQALTIPLSVVINAAMGRYLGVEDFGYIYLAGTFATFGFMLIDWGHNGALPAQVARDRSRSGILLGTSLVWRAGTSIIVYALLAAGVHLFGYPAELQWALACTWLGWMFNTWIAACKDTIRGFERTDIPALVHVGQQFLSALLVVAVLWAGGGMRASLLALAASGLLVLVPMWLSLRPAGVSRLAVERNAFRSLFVEGAPFVFFGLAMTVVPNIDAVYLSKLAPPEVMGWFAASRRLVGMLLLPASAMIGALYPTLCRLWVSDKQAFSKATSGSLHGTALVVVPVALACALYPEIGVSIFGNESYGPAQDNLRIAAPFLFLVYFSMPIGTALLAADRQRIWTVVQALCILTSVVLDPLLVPWFQSRSGNGGTGIFVTSVVSELIVVGSGLLLMPKGVFDRKLASSLFRALLSGGIMAAAGLGAKYLLVEAALGTRLVASYVSAAIALVAYAVALRLTGAIDESQLAAVKAAMGRKLARFRRSPSG
jgi:O-antigen/teichoic acid export membrane protein